MINTEIKTLQDAIEYKKVAKKHLEHLIQKDVESGISRVLKAIQEALMTGKNRVDIDYRMVCHSAVRDAVVRNLVQVGFKVEQLWKDKNLLTVYGWGGATVDVPCVS